MNKSSYLFFLLFTISSLNAIAQNYTSYRLGNNDITVTLNGGICLMGGASEDDEAMKWFLNRANGGDVLVLRTTGSDGYNNYFYNTLGVSINSVETIVCHNAAASGDSYIQQRIQEADAIWIAGGDQAEYLSYWENTAIQTQINNAVTTKRIAIGGTSAGMALMGSHYFTAQNGTISSQEALSNPYNSKATIDNGFLNNTALANVITDTHYDNPDRRGRHVSFIARYLEDNSISLKGIALEEYTAVCVDENNNASIYGDHPNFNDFAYFIMPNCAITNNTPENCNAGTALTWDQNGAAVKAYKIPGTTAGTNSFNLNTWQTGTGGTWENWSVNNGVLTTASSTAITCSTLSETRIDQQDLIIYNNFNVDEITITNLDTTASYQIYDLTGKVYKTGHISKTNHVIPHTLENGVFILKLVTKKNDILVKKLIID